MGEANRMAHITDKHAKSKVNRRRYLMSLGKIEHATGVETPIDGAKAHWLVLLGYVRTYIDICHFN